MEHSLLHAVVLYGLLAAVGGPFFMLGLLEPARKELGFQPASNSLYHTLSRSADHWTAGSALVAAAGTLIGLFVKTAEVRGHTVFSGVDLSEVYRFAAHTVTGRLSLACAGVLLLAAPAVWWAGPAKWWLSGVLGLSAVVLTALVSHAAAQPSGWYEAVAVQVTHLGGAALWLGVLVQMLAARPQLERATAGAEVALVAEVVRRFSPVALVAVAGVILTGVLTASRFLGSVRALVTSAYGLTLLVKVGLVVPAFFAGMVNYRINRPALLAVRDCGVRNSEVVLRRFGRTLELEVTAGLLVIAVAGILASISPPGQNETLCLTARQAHALWSPHLSAWAIPDPAQFYGAPTRTLEDLRYAEVTHHWSGVFVCLMGSCWLAQSVGGRLGKRLGNAWPLLMIPFTLFVAVAADPEVWWLNRVSLRNALSDPQLLEHELGAGMVLLLGGLGWMDRRRPEAQRPLGYALPVVMVIGSLSLLGHAHSALTSNDAVLNLISVQHTVFGAFGLFAGTVRWLSLRCLFPQLAARWIWPTLVIGLGLFMIFFYRELV